MKRTTITVGGKRYALAQGRAVDGVKAAAVAAVRTGGDLVDIVVLGNREVSVLISPGVPVQFETVEIPEDDRDDGDLRAPFETVSSFDDDYWEKAMNW